MVCSSTKIEDRAGQVNHNLLEYAVYKNFITCVVSPYKNNLNFQNAETRHRTAKVAANFIKKF